MSLGPGFLRRTSTGHCYICVTNFSDVCTILQNGQNKKRVETTLLDGTRPIMWLRGLGSC